jgi:hypothetical protein
MGALLLCEAPKRLSANRLSAILSVNPKTAYFLKHRIHPFIQKNAGRRFSSNPGNPSALFLEVLKGMVETRTVPLHRLVADRQQRRVDASLV